MPKRLGFGRPQVRILSLRLSKAVRSNELPKARFCGDRPICRRATLAQRRKTNNAGFAVEENGEYQANRAISLLATMLSKARDIGCSGTNPCGTVERIAARRVVRSPAVPVPIPARAAAQPIAHPGGRCRPRPGCVAVDRPIPLGCRMPRNRRGRLRSSRKNWLDRHHAAISRISIPGHCAVVVRLPSQP
jgi:hypothetical protein